MNENFIKKVKENCLAYYSLRKRKLKCIIMNKLHSMNEDRETNSKRVYVIAGARSS